MNYNLALPFYESSLGEPERLALVVDGKALSFRELGACAQAILSRLQGSPARVGILGEQSVGSYAGILAACASGAAYVPLSADWPEERLVAILETVELSALVVDARGRDTLSSPRVRAVAPKQIVDAQDFDTNGKPLGCPSPRSADALAYIMFTSGTTGKPKGVMISLGAVRQFIGAMNTRYLLSAEDRVSQQVELVFDVSLTMFWAWNSAASVHSVPASERMAPGRFIRESRLSVWISTPTVVGFMDRLKMLSPDAFPDLRYTVFTAEPVPLAAVERWRVAAPLSTIDDLYGPTEATVFCLGQRVGSAPKVTNERGVIGIGEPFAEIEAGILDQANNFLPRGMRGQLAVSGKQLATGYMNAPELAAERFVFIDGKRWYLTGDFAYQDADGCFHHLGRIDHMVKVLGNTVELEDVEANLRAACAAENVAAIAWPVSHGSAEGIVAFVSGAKISASEIRDAMRRLVPKYMVPSQVRFLDALPTNVNGKVDRQKLLALLETSP